MSTDKQVERHTARVAVVQDAIVKVYGAVQKADGDRSDAKTLLSQASEASTGAREKALLALAGVAARENWTVAEIDDGATLCVKAASEAANKKDVSLATFAGEIKTVCNPKVRADVGRIFGLATTVWTTEQERRAADKDAAAPVAKAFSRRYHLAIRLCRETIDGRNFATQGDIVTFAVMRDPDLDHEKVAKRFASIKRELASFANDFPVPGFDDILKFLAETKANQLKAARAKKLAAAATTPAPTPTGGPTPVSDLVDDIAREIAGA